MCPATAGIPLKKGDEWATWGEESPVGWGWDCLYNSIGQQAQRICRNCLIYKNKCDFVLSGRLARRLKRDNGMALAVGNTEYTHGAAPVEALGVSWTEQELEEGLADPIAAVATDGSGQDAIQSLLNGLPGTDFDPREIARTLTAIRTPEPWRVGEAIAEAYLVEHRQCIFPWPTDRDIRKPGSSLPGADLVGLKSVGEGHVFAFGEVKTSSENNYPPGVMYGDHGLKQQLEDLAEKASLRTTLVKYLAFRAANSSWKPHFQQAFCKFIQNSTEIFVCGFLVRDVPPLVDDLRARADALARQIPAGMTVELLAIYLPVGSVPGLGERVLVQREAQS